MEYLPWTVIYGAWIWRVSLLLLVAGAVFHVWLRPRRAARVRWRRTVREWGRPVSPAVELDTQTITIAGRLAASGACRRFEDAEEVAVAGTELAVSMAIHDRARQLRVECDGAEVELDGPVELAAGSEETWPGKRIGGTPLSSDDRVPAEQAMPLQRASRPVFRSLRPGDPVTARGVLRVAAPLEETDYRRTASRFVMHGAALAGQGSPRVRGPFWTAAVRPIALACLVFVGVFVGGGKILDGISKKEESDIGSLAEVLRGQRATRLLAATPLRRSKALERLSDDMYQYAAPTPEAREALVAIEDLRGGCGQAMEMMFDYRQFRRVLERASDCEDPEARWWASIAAYALGEFENASDHAPDLRREEYWVVEQAVVRHQLLAGQLAEAAETARPLADDLRRSADRYPYLLSWGITLECMADALSARAGDAAALRRLEQAVARGAASQCSLLLADLRTGAARKKLIPAATESRRWNTVALLLWLEDDIVATPPAGLADSHDLGEAMGTDLLKTKLSSDVHVGLGLEKAVLALLVGRKELPAHAARLRPLLVAKSALEEALLLRHDKARRLLAGIDAEARAAEIDLRPLRAAIELRAGDLAAARAALNAERSGPEHGYQAIAELVTRLERRHLNEDTSDQDRKTVLSWSVLAALRGDGDARTGKRSVDPYRSVPVADLVLIAHWLRDEPLALHLRFGRWGKLVPSSVDHTMRQLSDLGVVAEAVGDREVAAEMKAALARFQQASSRREIAVPLAVLDAVH
jgi:hypothetical protein